MSGVFAFTAEEGSVRRCSKKNRLLGNHSLSDWIRLGGKLDCNGSLKTPDLCGRKAGREARKSVETV